jgi:hypothetical protein
MPVLLKCLRNFLHVEAVSVSSGLIYRVLDAPGQDLLGTDPPAIQPNVVGQGTVTFPSATDQQPD